MEDKKDVTYVPYREGRVPNVYSQEELDAIRSEYARGSTDAQFTNFMRECQTRKMLPGKHLIFQLRKVSVRDEDTGAWIKEQKSTHVTSIDFFRLTAQRTGEYRGQGVPEYIYLDKDGAPTIFSTVPIPNKNPWAARVSVYREKFEKPIVATARFDAYAPTYRKGTEVLLPEIWIKRGSEQLSKCAEALALRQCFPEELFGLYISEEIVDEPEKVAMTTPAPSPATPPIVNQVPVEGTNTPRPGEKQTLAEFIESCDPTEEDLARHASEAPVHPESGQAATPKTATQTSAELGFPTKEQKKEFTRRMREYSRNVLPKLGITDVETTLRAFVTNATHADIKNLTVGQWGAVLNALDSARDKGPEVLKSVLQ